MGLHSTPKNSMINHIDVKDLRMLAN